MQRIFTECGVFMSPYRVSRPVQLVGNRIRAICLALGASIVISGCAGTEPPRYSVQLGVFSDEDRATNRVNSESVDGAGLFRQVSHVASAEGKDLWRALIDGFESEDAAKAYCLELRSRNVECLWRKSAPNALALSTVELASKQAVIGDQPADNGMAGQQEGPSPEDVILCKSSIFKPPTRAIATNVEGVYVGASEHQMEIYITGYEIVHESLKPDDDGIRRALCEGGTVGHAPNYLVFSTATTYSFYVRKDKHAEPIRVDVARPEPK